MGNRVRQGVKTSNLLRNPSDHHEIIRTHGKQLFPSQPATLVCQSVMLESISRGQETLYHSIFLLIFHAMITNLVWIDTSTECYTSSPHHHFLQRMCVSHGWEMQYLRKRVKTPNFSLSSRMLLVPWMEPTLIVPHSPSQVEELSLPEGAV